ncbi:hypothetical protein INT45_006712 [Circinella minor]|uniref:F-box domain-containing protein n=1 Tax=Circinella minor TaxID=1195481 RepID=A0A8H7S5A6_9FUNG|nr:hypothetical protein INT45_006712 [Circinella minor]
MYKETVESAQNIQYTTPSVAVSKQGSTTFQKLEAQWQTYLKQGTPDIALADAEQMINLLPHSAVGFIRKGEAYLMYGYKKKALLTYDNGLRSVTNTFDIQQLLLAREQTMMEVYNAKRIDFLACLPMEIVNEIVSRLSKTSKATCLSVSKTWRERTIESPDAWKYISIDNTTVVNIRIASILGHVAPRVRYFTLKNIHDSVHQKYLQNIRPGRFKKIQSLEMTGVLIMKMLKKNTIVYLYINNVKKKYIYVQNILVSSTEDLNFFKSMLSDGLWRMNKTLKNLDVHVGRNGSEVTLANILFISDALTNLRYQTFGGGLSNAIGDFSIVSKDHPLVSLDISNCNVCGPDIKIILGKCRKIRQLMMDQCEVSVLEPISCLATNLEVLVLNHRDSIPTVPDYNNTNYNDNSNNKVQTVTNKRSTITSTGLKVLVSNSSFHYFSVSELLPIIYKNKATLQSIFANVHGDISPSQSRQFDIFFPKFKLENVTSIVINLPPRLQPFLLRSLSNSTSSLANLGALNVKDINPLINFLSKYSDQQKQQQQPFLQALKLYNADIHSNITTKRNLIQLFKQYAKVSEDGNSLRHVDIQYCHGMTDAILLALGEIKTLKSIVFTLLFGITSQGMYEFIKKLSRHQQVISISLDELDCVNDYLIASLGGIESLTELRLERLHNVTGEGIRYLIDRKGSKLKTLILKNCFSVSQELICYAKQKLETFESD